MPLDRVLVNTLFDQKVPLANVKANSRASSDHVPLVVNFGVHDKPKGTAPSALREVVAAAV